MARRLRVVALEHEDLTELLGHPGRQRGLADRGALRDPVVGHGDVEGMAGPRLARRSERIGQRAGRFAGGVEVVRQLEDPVGVQGLDALGRGQVQPAPFGPDRARRAGPRAVCRG